MTDFWTYALAVPLADGQVLILGGYDKRVSKARNPTAFARRMFAGSVAFTILNSAEIYNPASGAAAQLPTLLISLQA